MTIPASWQRYKEFSRSFPDLGLTIDVSRMDFPDGFLPSMEAEAQRAYDAMDALEGGAIANPDEDRMVGHYWLRSPERAPTAEIRREIEETLKNIREFSYAVHSGAIVPEKKRRFARMLCIGIGGSALGPQFIADALGSREDSLKPHFLDNTDPDGFDRLLRDFECDLSETLTVVISKSGGTVETRNAMLEIAAGYRRLGLAFERHAVAVTGCGSALDTLAKSGDWAGRFPMWDWIGGRTSVLSAVGLLPASLQGLNVQALLQGAAACDALTRTRQTKDNPAALLALAWFHATRGRGEKDMVILPYKDRLQLFPRYLQQLIMESLGKERDVNGAVVHQGIAVYGNKGATDQHAYVQQLREGVNNFFATFIEILSDRSGPSLEVEPGVTSGDYLSAFFQGTRDALSENDRQSITITLERLDARAIGALIALYERAVGFYATLININAYHQPGVEAGKKMAGAVIALQRQVIAHLKKNATSSFSVEELAAAIGAEQRMESVFKILEHACANPDHGVRKNTGGGAAARYSALSAGNS